MKMNNNHTLSAFGLIYASCSVSLSHIARYTPSFSRAICYKSSPNHIEAIFRGYHN